MNHIARYINAFLVCLLVVTLVPIAAIGQEKIPDPTTYMKKITDVPNYKKGFDDPRPVFKTWNPKNMLPPAMYNMIAGDPEKMKAQWAEVVGFKAPDVVGKIHPEIKPGKYTYQDVQASPAFKELMFETLYSRIKPGGPPHVGNIPEFEIVPTQQYYYATRIAEATLANAGKTKQDANGYVDYKTWKGGYPFPKPSGPFKAQQVAYNAFVYRQDREQGNGSSFGRVWGFDRNLKMDIDNQYQSDTLFLAGRVLLPPYGWLDAEAESRGELAMLTLSMVTPRDIAGMSILTTYYLDPNKADAMVMYLPSLRRVRKMSSTDTQDPIAGQDSIYDDQSGFSQKVSPTRYPYKYEIVDEREFLVVAPTIDGAEYVTSKGLEYHNIRMERRPMYVLKMTQLDPNYVYSKRIFYVDKETFAFYQGEYYDRKGRLYRTFSYAGQFMPDIGMMTWGGYGMYRDYVDLHSDVFLSLTQFCRWSREQIIASLTKAAK
jgi:hypothetical protein